jgi:RND family efflux transporter MFP subunit
LTLQRAQDQQQTAQTNYDNFIAGFDSLTISMTKKELASAKMALTLAQKNLADNPQDIATQELTVKLDERKVEVAQKSLADAQKKLTTAQGMSPEIKAPFDGFVTAVNVKAGDNVYNGTIAATIADPNKFEASILVSEMDISQVKLGGDASVSVDVMQGISLPAKVTFISPTATIQSGVVNYSVKVELQSLEAVPEGFQLRQGLTVTVSIIVAERKNVLLVPKAAITSEAGQSYVQVVSSTGATEKRAIKTGITDYKNTEVTEGLNEGDKVSITQSAKTTTTTTQKQQQGGGIMIPGVGGGPPPPGG